HEPPRPITVSADPEGVGRILDNLLSNAIKFSPPGSTVRIAVGMSDDEATGWVEVTDEGPGIPEADRAKLVRRYARLAAQPTGGEPSSGLGLSIAQRLAEMMQGDLICAPPKTGGATFRLLLPAARLH